MDSLTIIWFIVCAYLLLNLLVGVYCHIRVKDSTDYLLAGRRIEMCIRDSNSSELSFLLPKFTI